MKRNIFFSAALLCSLATTTAYAEVHPLNNCAQLSKPKTVVLAYATWCKYSQQFLPVYKNTSNNIKYKDWTFYTLVDEDFSPVCNVEIKDKGVPITFKDNMQSYLIGAVPEEGLEHFLDDLNKASAKAQAFSCHVKNNK
jgi:hypothetical protein